MLDGNILLLNSGGLGSIAHLIIAQSEGASITSLHLNYGQDAAFQERRAALEVSLAMGTHLLPLTIARPLEAPIAPGHPVCSPEVGHDRNALIGRNLLLISAALVATQDAFDFILVGNCRGPSHYPDSSDEFILSMNRMLIFLGAKPRLISHLGNLSKAEAVRRAYTINPAVLKAHACYHAVECMVCPGCTQRREIVAGLRP